MRADLNVVSNLHQIVDLGSAADSRSAELGPIDAGARADLHIILDYNRSDLWNLLMLATIPPIAEAIAAQHGVGMNDDAVSDRDPLANDYLMKELAFLSDQNVGGRCKAPA